MMYIIYISLCTCIYICIIIINAFAVKKHGRYLHHVHIHLLQTERSASTVELLSALGDEDPDEQDQGLEAGDLMSFAQQIASGMVTTQPSLTKSLQAS